MNEDELCKVLKHCPLLETFAKPYIELRKTFNRSQMLNIISRGIIEERKEPEMDSIEERGSSSEEASARQ